jgi:hypothetical protein
MIMVTELAYAAGLMALCWGIQTYARAGPFLWSAPAFLTRSIATSDAVLQVRPSTMR